MASTRADDHGHFGFPLPPAGPYIVTAVAADGQRARALKIVINALAADVDIDVPSDPHQI